MITRIISPGESVKDYLIEQVRKILKKGITTEEILIMASKRTLIEEIRVELISLLPKGYGEMWVLTSAGLCNRFLNRFPFNMNRNLEIISGWKHYIVFEEVVSRLQLCSVFKHVQDKRPFLLHAMNFTHMLEQNDVRPGEFTVWAQSEGNLKFIDMARIYTGFLDFCYQNAVFTSQGLTRVILNQITDNQELAKFLSGKFKHILLADAQNIDVVYLKLVKLLSENGSCVTACVDAAGFMTRVKGAGLWDVLSFLGMQKEDMIKQRFVGSQNSLGAVVSSFFELAVKNLAEESGAVLVEVEKAADEVAWLVSKIGSLLNSGIAEEECVVFYRDLNNHPGLLETLKNNNITYSVASVDSYRQNPCLKFIIDAMRFIADPYDDNRLYQLLTSPVVGGESYQCNQLVAAAAKENCCLVDYVLNNSTKLEINTRTGIQTVLKLANLDKQARAVEVIEQLVKQFELYLFAVDHQKGPDMVSWIKDLLSSARFIDKIKRVCGKTFTVQNFLDVFLQPGFRIAQQNEIAESAGVTVTNIRQAESIKRRYVFILGAVDGLIPATRSPQCYFTGDEIKALLNEIGPLKVDGGLTTELIRAQEEQFFINTLKSAKERVYISFAKEYPGIPEAVPSVYVHRLLNFEEVCEESALKRGLGWESGEIKASVSMELPLVSYGKDIAARALATRCLFKGMKDVLRGCNYIEQLSEEVEPEYFLRLPCEPVEFKGVPYISASGIRVFLNCPRQFFLRKLLRLEEQGNDNMIFGSLVHSVLEQFHEEYPSLSFLDENLESKIIKMLDHAMENCIFSHFLVGRDWYRKASKIIFSYLEREKERWEEGRLVVHREHSIIWHGHNFRLKGAIDRIDKLPDGSYEVIDYKTGKSYTHKALRKKFMPPGDGHYVPEDLQLPIYYWALNELMPGINISRLTYYYLGEQAKAQAFQLVSGGDGENQLCPSVLNGVIKNKFREIIEHICKGEFPVQAEKCHKCGFVRFCSNDEAEGGGSSE